MVVDVHVADSGLEPDFGTGGPDVTDLLEQVEGRLELLKL